MSNLTAEQLLAAVGITRETDPRWWPTLLFDTVDYIGPELGSEALDAILLVGAQKLITSSCSTKGRTFFGDYSEQHMLPRDWADAMWHCVFEVSDPGHTLAQAIAKVTG